VYGVKRERNIVTWIMDLTKYGFCVDYLAGVYAHKGPSGLRQIEEEMKRVIKQIEEAST